MAPRPSLRGPHYLKTGPGKTRLCWKPSIRSWENLWSSVRDAIFFGTIVCQGGPGVWEPKNTICWSQNSAGSIYLVERDAWPNRHHRFNCASCHGAQMLDLKSAHYSDMTWTMERLTDLLGHAVDVRSRPGKGSVLAVEIPLLGRDAPPSRSSDNSNTRLTQHSDWPTGVIWMLCTLTLSWWWC